MTDTTDPLIASTAAITAAYVSRNQVPLRDLPALLSAIHETLAGLGKPSTVPASALTPAVPIKRSVTPDHIVCLEDGKKLKMLKRYLRTHYDLTPDQYRARWGLPTDYPMTAPNYADQRSTLAKSIGLGRRGAAT